MFEVLELYNKANSAEIEVNTEITVSKQKEPCRLKHIGNKKNIITGYLAHI